MADFIYGRQPLLEALKSTRKVHKIWIQAGSTGPAIEEIVRAARQKEIPIVFARPEVVHKMAKGHHQGVVAQADPKPELQLDELLKGLPPKAVLVALDEIQDPQNIGAILRSAGFFGVQGVIIPKWRSAPVGETVARISSGAVEHVPVVRITNMAQTVLDLQKAGFDVIGAEMEGMSLDRYQPMDKTAIILGNEGQGLRRLVKERCDKLVSIAGAGPVESLNVSAAAAILMYAICRGSSIGRAPVL